MRSQNNTKGVLLIFVIIFASVLILISYLPRIRFVNKRGAEWIGRNSPRLIEAKEGYPKARIESIKRYTSKRVKVFVPDWAKKTKSGVWEVRWVFRHEYEPPLIKEGWIQFIDEVTGKIIYEGMWATATMH